MHTTDWWWNSVFPLFANSLKLYPCFRLPSTAFPDIASVGRIEKKTKKHKVKKEQEVSEEQAWYPSIIVVELGNNEDDVKS